MSCRECRELMVPYLRNDVSAEQAAQVSDHVAACGRCAARLASETALRSTLPARYSIPDPSPGFEERVFAASRPQRGVERSHRRGWSTPVVGGAVAAALALGIALGMGVKPMGAPPVEPAQVEPVIQTVRLAFHSGEPLEDVTLTLELPSNVEVASFPGRHQLSWKVDLDQGENMLALPLRVLFPGAGELVARIDDGQRQKTFRAAIPGQNARSKTEPAS